MITNRYKYLCDVKTCLFTTFVYILHNLLPHIKGISTYPIQFTPELMKGIKHKNIYRKRYKETFRMIRSIEYDQTTQQQNKSEFYSLVDIIISYCGFKATSKTILRNFGGLSI